MKFEEIVPVPSIEGFVSVYLHTEDAQFQPLGADKQGYFVIPPKSILQEHHMKNLIVLKASEFIAKRMRPSASWGAGIGYLEVGEGYGNGTPDNPQPEGTGQTALRDPLTRKAITSWTYLDAANQPTEAETGRMLLTTIFNEDEANGSLVEMGLFGGDATASTGTGYMFNYKTFKAINKTEEMQIKLTVTWRLKF